MPVKLIALDMDGTLLNDEHEVSAQNHAVIKKALNRGIIVTVCTGRSNTELKPIIEQLPELRYFINGNGSKIYDKQKDQSILSYPISPAVAKNIYEIVRNYNIMLEVYTEDVIYTTQKCYDSAALYVPPQFLQIILSTRTPLANLDKFFSPKWKKPIYKINIFNKDASVIDSIREKCKNIKAEMTSSIPAIFEFTSLLASKGNALAGFAARLELKADEVMAVGDNRNDLSMLRYAGYSVAMQNAIEEVKKIAKYETLNNNEHGVAAAIERYALC